MWQKSWNALHVSLTQVEGESYFQPTSMLECKKMMVHLHCNTIPIFINYEVRTQADQIVHIFCPYPWEQKKDFIYIVCMVLEMCSLSEG